MMFAMRVAVAVLGVVFVLGGCASAPAPPPAPPPAVAPPPPAPSPPPPPAPPPAPQVQKLTLASRALFDFNKAVLNSEGMVAIDRDLISKLSGVTRLELVLVTGFADPTEGTQAESQKLSERRANAVRDYLVSKGVAKDKIETLGLGKTQPLPGLVCTRKNRNELIVCYAPDRRVEVEITGEATALDGRRPSITETRLVPILYGTNRKKSGNNYPDKYFLNQQADKSTGKELTLGRIVISVPPGHVKGVTETPSTVLRFTLERLPSSWQKIVGVGSYGVTRPRYDFAFAGPIEELTDAAFRSDLQQLLAASSSGEALLFVHGYANTFAYAAYRTAQLTFDLAQEGYEVVPLMFSWPSDPDPIGENYMAAKDSVRSASRQLAEFLKTVGEATSSGVVHIVAHSMGAEVLTAAFKELGMRYLIARMQDGHPVPVFHQIVLAAPDIRASDFEALILPAVASGHRVTNYASSNDLALMLSERSNQAPRAGDSRKGLAGVKGVNGVETIDASKVNNSSAVGHAYFADAPPMIHDIKELLQHGTGPELRGLRPARLQDWTYWYFPSAAGP